MSCFQLDDTWSPYGVQYFPASLIVSITNKIYTCSRKINLDINHVFYHLFNWNWAINPTMLFHESISNCQPRFSKLVRHLPKIETHLNKIVSFQWCFYIQHNIFICMAGECIWEQRWTFSNKPRLIITLYNALLYMNQSVHCDSYGWTVTVGKSPR